MNTSNINTEYYKKKYLKYKAKYLQLQLGGIYFKGKNVINPNIATPVGKVRKCKLLIKDCSSRTWNKIPTPLNYNPNLLAFDKDSNIVIANDNGNYLSVINEKGHILKDIIGNHSSASTEDKDKKKFTSVAFYYDKIILVDNLHKEVLIHFYPSDLQVYPPIKEIQKKNLLGQKSTPIKFQGLYGVAVTLRKDEPVIYITDNNNIHMFTLKEGKFIKTITDTDTKSIFICIAFDSKNHIVVTDRHNNCIKIFNDNGTSIGTYRDDNLIQPHGITFDGNNDIIVANKGNNNILSLNIKYEEKGNIILSQQKKPICVIEPVSILIDESGNIIYSNRTNLLKEKNCRKEDELSPEDLWVSTKDM